LRRWIVLGDYPGWPCSSPHHHGACAGSPPTCCRVPVHLPRNPSSTPPSFHDGNSTTANSRAMGPPAVAGRPPSLPHRQAPPHPEPRCSRSTSHLLLRGSLTIAAFPAACFPMQGGGGAQIGVPWWHPPTPMGPARRQSSPNLTVTPVRCPRSSACDGSAEVETFTSCPYTVRQGLSLLVLPRRPVASHVPFLRLRAGSALPSLAVVRPPGASGPAPSSLPQTGRKGQHLVHPSRFASLPTITPRAGEWRASGPACANSIKDLPRPSENGCLPSRAAARVTGHRFAELSFGLGVLFLRPLESRHEALAQGA